MSDNRIKIMNYEFSDADNSLIDIKCSMTTSLNGEELAWDTLSFAVSTLSTKASDCLQASDGYFLADSENFLLSGANAFVDTDLASVPYGTEVKFYHNNEFFAKFYINKSCRTGIYSYEFECISAIGLLANTKHYGGLVEGASVGELAGNIIGDEIPFTVEDCLSNVRLYGWLPVASKRDNLHQLLLACGGSVKKNEYGDVVIGILDSQVQSIDDGRIFESGSIETETGCNSITVSEHSFIKSAETTSIFSGEVENNRILSPNGTVFEGQIITFDQPFHDLAAAGCQILEYGDNYAVLSPCVSAELKGKKYIHQTKEIFCPEKKTAYSEFKISDATLVSILNSENVAKRFYSFYQRPIKSTFAMILQGERTGTAIQCLNPFGISMKGTISEMTITPSAVLKADITLYEYIQGSYGNTYNNRVEITQNGSYTIPAGIEKIKVILIGGGNGGNSGYAGTDGGAGGLSTFDSPGFGTNGEPGDYGDGGLGGKIYIETLNVSGGDIFPVEIGQGGIGADYSNGNDAGGIGTDTQFGNLTSASGLRLNEGFRDLLADKLFGAKGKNGISGGYAYNRVSGTQIISYNGIQYSSGSIGDSDSGSVSSGGTLKTATVHGGLGGGSAAGTDGMSGYAGEYVSRTKVICGQGGNGGMPVQADNGTTYGQGGQGGHGGGAGGGGGALFIPYEGGSSPAFDGTLISNGGSGGIGGKGGNGANGCVIIYY